MIPIDQIITGDLYSQEDALFLLGKGFSEEAAREAICEACRSGQLKAKQWRKRWWYTGQEFLAWVSRWSGTEIEPDRKEDDPLARVLPLGDNGPTKQEPVALRKGGR